MKYHVHIYQIAMRGEVNLDAKSEQEAREKALSMARKGEVSLYFPDCGALAIAFLDEKLHRPSPGKQRRGEIDRGEEAPMEDIEGEEKAIKIIEILDGMPVGQARWVLNLAKDLIASTHRVDIKNRDFIDYAQEVRRLYAR